MLLLKKNNFEIQTPVRLVKASEAASVIDAQKLILDAEAEAARIREEAKSAYEEEKKRGYEKGLEEGRAAIIARKLEQLDESIKFMEAVEGRMVDVVMQSLKKCVMEIGDRELVVQIVRKVMNAVVRNQRHITLKVAPEMVEVVRRRLDEILAEYPLLNEIDVQEDSRLKGASCMLETEAGIADASIDTQLAAIENSFRKHFSKEA